MLRIEDGMLENLFKIHLAETFKEGLDVDLGQYIGEKLERDIRKSKLQLEFKLGTGKTVFYGYLTDNVNDKISYDYYIEGSIAKNGKRNILNITMNIPYEILRLLALTCIMGLLGFIRFSQRGEILVAQFFIIGMIIYIVLMNLILFRKLQVVKKVILSLIQ
jgi:hypothetical protein